MRGLHGVIPPLATPLTTDAEVDVAALERLTSFQLDAGVHGVFVLGSTGEAPYLNDAQRRQVAEVVRGVNAGAVPLLIGSIDMAGNRAVDRAVEAERWGADAVVATPPFFAMCRSEADTLLHYGRIAAAVDVPVIMYHVPSRTGSSVTPDVVTTLAERKVISGIKDSGPDFAAFRQSLLATEHVPEFTAFTGSEVLVDAALLAGAAGVMPGLANLDPHGFVRLYEAAARSDWPTAVAEQDRLARLLRVIVHGPERAGADGQALVVFKEAMRLRGVISATTSLATDEKMTPSSLDALRIDLEAAELA